MKLKKVIKKIVALGMGITMIGATILGAGAVTLSDYPEPFVKNGQFDATLVIGNKAAAEDVIGVSGIASSLQYAVIGKRTIEETGGLTVIGDAWKIRTSSKDFGISGNDGQIETVNSIVTSIGEDELESLQEEEIRNSKGTAKYHQYINFDNTNTEYVMYLENDDDELGDYLYIENGDNVMTYEIDFIKSFKSDIEDDTDLEDYEGEKLIIMGKEFTITKARVSDGEEDVKLTLMGGSVKETLGEGKTKTYTINDEEYEVTVTTISDKTEEVKFVINGEVTDSLEEGQTYVLNDDTEIGVLEVIPNEAGEISGGEDMVTFTLGATKIELIHEDELEIGNDRIDDTLVTIESSNDGSVYTINSIMIEVNADDDIYVEPGKKVSQYLDEPKALLGFDIVYEGLDNVDTEEISITGSEQEKELTFVDGNSNEISVPVAYADGNTIIVGDDDDDFVFTEGTTINIDDYFLLSSGDDSYVLQYTDSKDKDSNNPSYRFKVLSGDTLEVDYDEDDGTGNIRLGGNDYNVKPVNVGDIINDDFNILVDLDGENGFGTNNVAIKTKAEANIDLVYGNNTLTVTISTDGSDSDEPEPTDIIYSLTADDDEIDLDRKDNYTKMEKDGDTYTGYTTYGTKIEFDTDSNDVVIEYPEEQRLAIVYAISGDVEIIGGDVVEKEEDDTPTSVLVDRISVTATKLASEISGQEKTQNLILVGGPCANDATNVIMGNPDDCAEGFESGKGILKLYENDGNVALLVAGYSAQDTRTACAIISDYNKYILEGNEMIVTTATSTVTEAVETEVTETQPVNETV